ncbi:hypothetical protein CGCSCA5_v013180 [Colletotrichum siamense]|nr:hypothetical protein CGCSCA5_v013180 [Colletotrichum siamense]
MLPSTAASVAKRQRPDPAPDHEENACYAAEDDEMDDGMNDTDFRFFDIDTEPGTRVRKAAVPRETGCDDDFECCLRPPSALDLDSGDVEAWHPYIRERLHQLEDIIRDFRILSEQQRTTNENTDTTRLSLYESLVMRVHSEGAELRFALGQTDENRYNFPMMDKANSEALTTWRTQWQKRRALRGLVKEASKALSDCYRSLSTEIDAGLNSTVELGMPARLESARQKLEQAISSQGSRRIRFPPRVRRENSDKRQKGGIL